MKRRTFIQIGLGTAAAPVVLPLHFLPELDTGIHRDLRPSRERQNLGTSRFVMIPPGQEEFYRGLWPRHAIMLKHGEPFDRLVVQPERNGFRMVHVWIGGTKYSWRLRQGASCNGCTEDG